MSSSGRPRNGKLSGANPPTSAPTTRRAWLSPPIGVAIIVGLAAAASFAQATPEIFIAASLLFSLGEGVVLASVGFAWSPRGRMAAMLAGAATAAVAAPVRWEVTLLRYGLPVQKADLVQDLGVSIAWGALAGLAGATILRPKLAALMHDTEQRNW